jgi:hypothetical protein
LISRCTAPNRSASKLYRFRWRDSRAHHIITIVRTRPGDPYPLGALGRLRVNVALFSENATDVELCVFDGESVGGDRYDLEARCLAIVTTGALTFDGDAPSSPDPFDGDAPSSPDHI